MPFQFYCPQGHLLEGHESQMGQQSQCPLCGALFVIPVIQAAPVAPGGWVPNFSPAGVPDPFRGADPAAETFPQLEVEPPIYWAPSGGTAGPPAAEPSPPELPPAAAAQKEEPKSVRIPCPRGHELETPAEMIGQEALCPICNVQFRLRYEDSIEHKRELAEARRRREEQLNRQALKWAIIAAAVVVLGILGMIIYLALR